MIAQGGAIAPSSFGRGSRGLLCKVYSLEDKKRGGGQSKERSQKTKACKRGEKEKKVGVHLTIPEQSASRECCFIGRH